MSRTAPKNIMTINLEDYFQVGTLSKAIPERYWPRFEMRVEKNTLRTLDLLDRYGVKATFFSLGWIADQCPELFAEISRRGHEVASKGYYHRSIKQLSPDEFRADAVASRLALEKACGHQVSGYRIAKGWFSRSDLWALDILAEEGFLFDSSIRPLGFDLLGYSKLRRIHKHQTPNGEIWEFPLSAAVFAGLSLPISGGNYVRQLPHTVMRRLIANKVRAAKDPFMFYFHVWELDPEQPRMSNTPVLNQVRQYRNLDAMADRIEYYLQQYSFSSIADYLQVEPQKIAATQGQEAHVNEPVLSGKDLQPITVVIPCYNEEPVLKYLANTLARFSDKHRNMFDLSFVFVDDGSTDKTWQCLHDLFGDHPKTKIIRHDKNRGVAAASMTGIRAAATETVCVIDCDCTYDPDQLVKMVGLLDEDVDLVTASPYHKDGQVINVPKWRLFLSRQLSRLYRLVLKHKFDTYTACFRVYRRSAVVPLQIKNEGYFGIAEILAQLDIHGSKIVECPAVLEARLMGQSKMKTVLTALGHLRLLADLFMRKYHKRKSENQSLIYAQGDKQ